MSNYPKRRKKRLLRGTLGWWAAAGVFLWVGLSNPMPDFGLPDPLVFCWIAAGLACLASYRLGHSVAEQKANSQSALALEALEQRARFE